MRQETIAVHSGRRPDPSTGAVVMPISLSTTFQRGEDGSYPGGFEYTREANPNRNSLETCLASLENGCDAVAFASGMAATTAVIEAIPLDRRHVVIPDDMYFGNRGLLARPDLASLRVTEVDMQDLLALRRACAEGPALVWVETPSNPLVKVVDIAAIASIAHDAGAMCAVDNTWATPSLQRPLELGADFVMHSITKYIGGHSDLMAGAIIAREAGSMLETIRSSQHIKGSVPSPFDCWLAMRGVQTLPIRMRAHSASALEVAGFLDGHPAVTAVHYPGLPTNSGHEIAKRQMSSFGGMLSCEVGSSANDAKSFVNALKLFTRATSLGGASSLIEHRASVEGPATRAPQTLLRISVGLEHPMDLIEDLTAALDVVVRPRAGTAVRIHD
jgi:cystathionine gamma-synthase